MEPAIPIIMIAVGALVALIKGVMGKGLGFGRGKFILDKFGPVVARIINIVSGLMVVTLGILMPVHPEWFGLGK